MINLFQMLKECGALERRIGCIECRLMLYHVWWRGRALDPVSRVLDDVFKQAIEKRDRYTVVVVVILTMFQIVLRQDLSMN